MDVLRKELNQIYASQRLAEEVLVMDQVEACKRMAISMVMVTNACCVITDAASDRCFIYGGELAPLLGLAAEPWKCHEYSSSDEDEIYARIHPADLVDKRMLEYEFFRFVDPLPFEEKVRYKATCRIRVKDRTGRYVAIDNSTQILCPSPRGKIWLILCCYDLAPTSATSAGIDACIKNNQSGEVISLSFTDKRGRILTRREREILYLIKEGRPSKLIAEALGISLHTVNRHRQNILERLNVGNSLEAVMAATSMGLL